jgi:hypothetical protein
MPRKETIERARRAEREGKSASTRPHLVLWLAQGKVRAAVPEAAVQERALEERV